MMVLLVSLLTDEKLSTSGPDIHITSSLAFLQRPVSRVSEPKEPTRMSQKQPDPYKHEKSHNVRPVCTYRQPLQKTLSEVHKACTIGRWSARNAFRARALRVALYPCVGLAFPLPRCHFHPIPMPWHTRTMTNQPSHIHCAVAVVKFSLF